ncbi:alpha/beta fold hydrolase [Mucilaginibacter sp. UYCu711]|uniref:alpha/beta fold hydrolase n=1 Tax=Mucilaginibacter sp. UYCu711 TaxID=3156339 RepID=UPI003D1DBD8F
MKPTFKKHAILIASILMLGITAPMVNAQNAPAPSVTNYAFFTREINVAQYAGKKMRLTAFVKVSGSDSAECNIITLVKKKDNSPGFRNDFHANMIKRKTWQQATVEGPLDATAKTLQLGGYCKNNGSFFFDDFNLSVETSAGKYEKLALPNGGFENADLSPWVAGTPSAPMNFDGVSFQQDQKDAAIGKGALRIDANHVDYGKNDSAGGYADVNGIKLYYEVYGQGKPLLLLHGNGGSIKGHSARISYFKQFYKVIAVDSRAQGRSGDANQELTYDLMTDDINKLLNVLHIDSAYIWGQSDGGIIGLILAMEHPDKVRKLATWGANIQADSTALLPEIYRGVVDASKNSTDPKAKKLNMLMAKYPNIAFAKLNKISVPAMIMSGDRDAIQLTHTLEIYKHLPHGQLFIMPGATHYGAYESPNLFNQVLKEFFDKQSK